MNLDGINAKKGSIYQDNSHLKINNSKLNNLSFRNNTGGVNIKNSEILNSKFKTYLGDMKVDNSKLQKSLFVSEDGYLNFTNMNSETDVKGSSKHDYIHLDYKDEPKILY